MRVLVTGSTGNVGSACIEETLKLGHKAISISSRILDLTSWDAVDRWAKSQRPFDIVIMTHGVQRRTFVDDMYFKDWDFVMRGNLESCIALTGSLLHYNKVAENGLVVYCSSIQATQPREGRAAYAIAKAGLEALARVVAVENDVRAVALRLGQMTKQMKGINFDEEESSLLKARCKWEWVSPEQVAKFIFGLWDLPITGETIEITSGQKLKVWE